MSSRDRFLWMVGIENAVIPDMNVDEYAWTRHRERWREDLALAREAGANAIRYGVTWPEVEQKPGRYDWHGVDEVVDELVRLGLEPVWDLVHFGTPAWLEGGVQHPEFADRFARYAAAFAERYRGTVAKLTPWNEPYITCWFRAGWGIWPPHLTGRDGFVRYLHPLVTGLRRAIREVARVAPDTEIWLNDGADTFHAVTPDLRQEAAFRSLQRYAAFDLLLGLAEPGQETYDWLRQADFPERDLSDEPVEIHVIGLDYYPETEHDLVRGEDGPLETPRATNPLGLAATAVAYQLRYDRPLFVAESSASGSDEERRAWIDWNLSEMRVARAGGVDWRGYTWWPLFDHVDWNTLLRQHDGFVCPAGLYHLTPTVSDRAPTDAVDAFRAAVRSGLGAA